MSDPSAAPVLLEFPTPGVALLRLNRPQATNALSLELQALLSHYFTQLAADPDVRCILLTGGDTLLQCMNSVGVHELEPICEMERGVVLARFGCGGTTRYVITKSGGFGQADLLTALAKRIAD